MIKKALTFSVLAASLLEAKPVSLDAINPNSFAIQIATVKELKNLDVFKPLEKEFDTYLKKDKSYIYYIVNLDKQTALSTIKRLKKRYKGIFLVNSPSKLLIKDAISSSSYSTKLNSDDYELNLYKTALAYYKAKDYKRAYKLFDELFQNNTDDIFVNYYLGRSAFELQMYELAVGAYDRILINHPDNYKVRLELGQTYLKMGLWAQALDEYTAASKGKLPKQIEQRVEKTIEILKNKQQKHSVTLYTLFSVMYDSNIHNSSSIGSFDIYSPELNTNLHVSNSTQEESAMVYQQVASINHKYKLDDNLLWDSNLTGVNLKYNNHKEKDIMVFSMNSGPMYYAKEYKFATMFMLDKVYLGHENYQLNYYLRPEYTVSISEKSIYTTALKIGQVNYTQKDDYDANVVEFSNQLRYLSDDYGLFGLRLNLGRERELNETRTDISLDYYYLELSNSFALFDSYTLMSSMSYKKTDFIDFDQNFQNERVDKTKEFSLGIEKQIDNNKVISFGSTYTSRDSNQEPSSYNKYLLKLSLYMSF